jgi:2'-5' RNA ligase
VGGGKHQLRRLQPRPRRRVRRHRPAEGEIAVALHWCMASLFLALFPPPAVAQRIVAEAAQVAALGPHLARSIPAERLHITIAYLGDRGDDTALIEAVSRAIDRLESRPVDVELNRVRTFGDSGSRAIVMTGRFDNAPAARLRRDVAAILADVAEFDAASEFVPHVTLLYADAAVDAELREGIALRCSSLALVRGGDYARLHERALTTDGATEYFGNWHDNPIPSARDATPEELESMRPMPKP